MTRQDIRMFLSQWDTKDFLNRHQIKHLWLTGSRARWDNNENSDIDLLYEFDEQSTFDDWGIINAKLFLQDKLQKNIDLIDKDYIKPRAKQSLLENAIAVW